MLINQYTCKQTGVCTQAVILRLSPQRECGASTTATCLSSNGFNLLRVREIVTANSDQALSYFNDTGEIFKMPVG